MNDWEGCCSMIRDCNKKPSCNLCGFCDIHCYCYNYQVDDNFQCWYNFRYIK